eukprot:Pgem_evm1s14000
MNKYSYYLFLTLVLIYWFIIVLVVRYRLNQPAIRDIRPISVPSLKENADVEKLMHPSNFNDTS